MKIMEERGVPIRESGISMEINYLLGRLQQSAYSFTDCANRRIALVTSRGSLKFCAKWSRADKNMRVAE
jgi:hypothetical protein